MGKVANESVFLYKGFRTYVPKKKRVNYDNEFLSRKVHTIKFMTEFIHK